MKVVSFIENIYMSTFLETLFEYLFQNYDTTGWALGILFTLLLPCTTVACSSC
jgi:hypothetical protein